MILINQLIATFTLLFSAFILHSQVNLGTASDFILFTSIGAIDNVGPSVFTGDVGTQAGAITGFPPGIVNGQILQADAVTLQASADVETAYNYLTSVPCDSMLGTLLGGGQLLTANNYCISAAATLNGTLTLDGENNPNSIFIIKINGLLDVIAASEVILINSALISNVFWQINGAVNIGTNVTFKGVILANGALTFAQGAVLNGNGLTRAGAISTFEMTGAIPSDSGMAIELIYFMGEVLNADNLLTWSSASEMNNDYFTIEKSTNGLEYQELIRINGAGTNSSTSYYNYTDFDPEKKINYYRLSHTDYDGITESFVVISLNNTQTQKQIIKIVNLLGQDVDEQETGIRLIYFSNGEILKFLGKYVY